MIDWIKWKLGIGWEPLCESISYPGKILSVFYKNKKTGKIRRHWVGYLEQ